MYQGGSTFLPLRVNQAGVIPIIFAISILLFPSQIAHVLPTSTIGPIVRTSRGGSSRSSTSTSAPYLILYFVLTVGFTYFYTAFTFKPDETAEQLRKNGGFIPGIRPGPADPGLPRQGRLPDHDRRRPVPGHRRRRAAVRRGHRARASAGSAWAAPACSSW